VIIISANLKNNVIKILWNGLQSSCVLNWLFLLHYAVR